MDEAQRTELIKLSNFFDENNWPHIKCPFCKLGQLAPDKITSVESVKSKAARAQPDWDPFWIHGIFSALLKCTNCNSEVFAQGLMGVDIIDVDPYENGMKYSTCYKVKYFSEPLDIMSFPKGCSDEVKSRVNEVSNVLWINPDAATNRLRVAIDELLTALKIPRNQKNKKSQWEKLSTHARIQLLKKKNVDAASLLEAVKWIGNDGSHDKGLSVSDVLDGIQLYNRALNLIYDRSDQVLIKKAAAINSRKGVKSRKTTRK